MMMLLPLLFVLQATPAAQPVQATPMVTYQMVFLRKGPNGDAAPADAKRLQDAHLANLNEMNRQGINLLYGPLLDGQDLRGIAILNVASADEARQRFVNDPYVKAGMMVADVRPWYGPRDGFHSPLEPKQPEQLVLGFLVAGPDRSQDEKTAKRLQEGHLVYLGRLASEGTLVMAGPFMDEGNARGIVIYRVPGLEDAARLAAGDPAVKAGRLRLEAHPWMTWKGILK